MKKIYTEGELVSGCRNGNRIHQQALYQRYYRKMFGVCLRYAEREEDAQDMLQDGFIRVFKSIGTFRGSGSLEGWVRRIMVNNAIQHYRKNSKFRKVDIEAAENVELDGEILSNMGQAELLKVINHLPVGYRTVFNLYVIEGYNHQEISFMLNISPGTSKSQLSRAKAHLKKQLTLLNQQAVS